MVLHKMHRRWQFSADQTQTTSTQLAAMCGGANNQGVEKQSHVVAKPEACVQALLVTAPSHM
jgi:hypothetical protein